MDAAATPTCKNCNTALLGPHCHQCGQKREVRRSLAALGHELVQSLFNFEGNFFRTLPMLAWRPGELTRRYIDGERAKFISPLTTFLFSVFLLATVLSNLPGKSPLEGMISGLREGSSDLTAAERDIRAKLAAAQAERAVLVAAKRPTLAVDARISEHKEELGDLALLRSEDPTTMLVNGSTVDIPFLDIDQRWQRAKKNPDLLLYKIKESAYATSWLLVPMSLPFVWLLFPFSRRFRMYDHAVFVIYSLSFMSLLVIAVALLDFTPLDSAVLILAMVLIPPIHLFRQLRGAYGLRKRHTIWRLVLLLLFASIVLMCWVVVLMLLGAA